MKPPVHDARLTTWTEYVVDWRKRKRFRTDWSNFIEKLWLIDDELHEAGDAHRNAEVPLTTVPDNVTFDHIGEELSDAIIRLLDLMGSLGYCVPCELIKKMTKNEQREELHGKRY